MITVEVKEMFSRYTNDTIASSAFGLKTNSLKDPENEFYTFGKRATNFTGIQMLKSVAFIIVPKLTKVKYYPFACFNLLNNLDENL